MAFAVQRFDGLQLIGRQQVALGLVDADLGGDGLGRVRVVAGQHQRLDAQFMQLLDGLAAALLDGVRYREQCHRATAVEQQDHRLTLAFQPIELRFELR
ncbi:hypothetical protein D9M71_128300 [compost metagenome]